MTKKLYLDDSYKTEFEAEVISSEGKNVILDQTCFYPEVGGQPSDHGYLNGINVLNVRKEEEDIVHILEKPIDADRVKGEIDWHRRFENMQQHTGQHILSRTFIDLFGESAYSTSLHMGKNHNTIDIFGKYTKKDIKRVETLANNIIFENRKVKCYFTEREEIKNGLRKRPEGIKRLRIVEINNFDLTACGGTHLHTTGETGMIKIIDFRKKGEFTRVEFVCGIKALRDYRKRNDRLKKAVDLLNSQDIAEGIRNLQNKEKKLQKKIRDLKNTLSTYEADELIKKAEEISGYTVIIKIYDDKDIEPLIKSFDQDDLVVFLADRKNTLVMGFSRIEAINIGEILGEIGSFVEGGGGGSETIGKAGGSNPDGIEEAFEFIKEKIKKIGN
ncbi:MAG: DHHA1 domain-containing protein [Euryarchaeota archaeon]|nr:DHHA1 domain-containing protein [Euryarchaeota archaeon]